METNASESGECLCFQYIAIQNKSYFKHYCAKLYSEHNFNLHQDEEGFHNIKMRI